MELSGILTVQALCVFSCCEINVSRKFNVPTHWTDKICLALPKISTKFVSAKFSICQAWAHWDGAKYVLTTSVNHTEISTFKTFFYSRLLLNPQLGGFQFDQWCNLYMCSADSGGLHTDVFLVGLHRDVQIEQYLALEMQLERKLESRISCILSKDSRSIPRYESSNFTV